MKYALWQTVGMTWYGLGMFSLGNLKMYEVLTHRMSRIRVDSEALDDQKAGQAQWRQFSFCTFHLATWQVAAFKESFTKTFSLEKQFPKVSSEYPAPLVGKMIKNMMACVAVEEEDWESAESLLKDHISGGMEKYLILPINSNVELYIACVVNPILALYNRKVEIGEDPSIYENAIKAMRDSLDTFSTVIPGAHRCSGIVHIARITLALKDRPFSEIFKKLEKAYTYATELACLPLDILYLELEIARWQGNGKKVEEVCHKFEELNY